LAMLLHTKVHTKAYRSRDTRPLVIVDLHIVRCAIPGGPNERYMVKLVSLSGGKVDILEEGPKRPRKKDAMDAFRARIDRELWAVFESGHIVGFEGPEGQFTRLQIEAAKKELERLTMEIAEKDKAMLAIEGAKKKGDDDDKDKKKEEETDEEVDKEKNGGKPTEPLAPTIRYIDLYAHCAELVNSHLCDTYNEKDLFASTFSLLW
jgi:hypothetical protein